MNTSRWLLAVAGVVAAVLGAFLPTPGLMPGAAGATTVTLTFAPVPQYRLVMLAVVVIVFVVQAMAAQRDDEEVALDGPGDGT